MLDDTLTDLRQTIAALERMLDARTGQRDEALAQGRRWPRCWTPSTTLRATPNSTAARSPSTVGSASSPSSRSICRAARRRQTAGRGGVTASARLLRRGACPRAAQSADPGAPRNDMICFVIASGAKQSRSRAALRCSDIFEPMQKSLFNSPSPPLGAERVGVRWGSGRSVVAGVAHLTLPVAESTGPLPLPPQAGGEGKIARRPRCKRKCVNTVARAAGRAA